MAIKTPSFSDLVVSPQGAGSAASPLSSDTASALSGFLSRGPTVPSSVTSTLTKADPPNRGGAGGALSDISSVYDFDSTVYDTEITGSGATSAYPLVLATLPMKNLYAAGKETNVSKLLEIQNDLREETARKAESIVSQYYTLSPVVSGTLATLRNTNLSKYNTLVSSVSEIARLRDDIVNSADTASASERQQNIVDSNSSTTDADAVGTAAVTAASVEVENLTNISLATQSGLSSAFSSLGTSSQVTTYGNATVYYVDDDVSKYNNGKNVTSSLTEKLLGISNQDDQARTTRQYQLFKAAWNQILNGRNLSDISSLYSDLDYTKISSISEYSDLSTKSIVTARGFLESAGSIISRGYIVDASESDSGDAILSDLSQKGVYYAGRIKFESVPAAGTSVLITASINDNDVFIDKSTNFYHPDYVSNGFDNLPIVGLNIEELKGDLINQFAPALASLIMDATLGPVTLPNSLNPDYSNDVKVKDTYQDSLRYIVRNSQNENIFLFDDSLQGSLKDKATPVSTILTANISDISSIQEQVESIYDNLESFVSDNRAYITNQCALTILSVFYSYMKSYFSTSSLFDDGNSDGSAFRCALFARAAGSTSISAKLFRFLQDKNTIGWRSYEGYTSLTSRELAEGLVTTLSLNDTVEFTRGSTRINTSLGLSRRDFDNGQGEDVDEFVRSMFQDTSFAELQRLISELSVIYPVIGTNEKLQAQIQIAYYYMFLFFLKNVYCDVKVSLDPEPYSGDADTGKSDYSVNTNDSRKLVYSGFLRRSKPDIAFLNDVLSEVFNVADASDLAFSSFADLVGSAPDDEQISTGSALFFKPARTKISYALQIYQDFRSLIAYQLTILRSQSNNMSRIISLYGKISDQFGGDSNRAAKLISRYLTLESVTEALYRSGRYQTFIPDTNISSFLTRSKNYRTIVRTAFKNIIPSKENLKICVIGIPYGFLERLRLAQDQREFYFGVTVNTDVLQNFEDPYVEIDYKFGFVNKSKSLRPNLAGPYSVQIANLYDDFESTEVVSSITNENIKYLQLSSDGRRLDVIRRADASSNSQSIDFPATIVQAALQSYVEDLYGLYPRFASTKIPIDPDSFTELRYAELALKASGYNQDNEENSLIYNRLKSAIMMHRDFVTSRMLADLEASSVFDKIIYTVVDGNVLPDIITQFYCKVGV